MKTESVRRTHRPSCLTNVKSKERGALNIEGAGCPGRRSSRSLLPVVQGLRKDLKRDLVVLDDLVHTSSLSISSLIRTDLVQILDLFIDCERERCGDTLSGSFSISDLFKGRHAMAASGQSVVGENPGLYLLPCL